MKTVIHARDENSLKNGSFHVERVAKKGNGTVGHYMNGDFMGWLQAVPPGLKQWNLKDAKKIMPKGI